MYPIQGPLTVDDHFDDGDVQTGREATDLTAKFLNDVQDEILNAVEDSGQTPSPDDQSQLSKAINLRGFHVFDGASDALDSDTGIPSGKVKNAIVVLHNAVASTVDGFQFPSPANCQNLGMVIVVPDWSGTGASQPTASVAMTQSSGSGVLPVFNGNIFIAIFNGNGALNSAKTLSIPYRGGKTFSEIGKLVIDGDLRVISTALFEASVTINGSLSVGGNLTAVAAQFTSMNSAGFIELANSIGNSASKRFIGNGNAIATSQFNGTTIDVNKSFLTATANVNLRTVTNNLLGAMHRLIVYNNSSSNIVVTYHSDKCGTAIRPYGCCEFICISGTAGAYEWAAMGDWAPSVG